MSAKWGRNWRKLYRDPSPAWLMLSYSARGLGYEILRVCDDDGRIDCGSIDPFEVVARLCVIGGHKRRAAKEDFDALKADGFIVLEDTFIVVRNFHAAQETLSPAAAKKAAQRARAAAVEASKPTELRPNSDRTLRNFAELGSNFAELGSNSVELAGNPAKQQEPKGDCPGILDLEETKTKKRLEEEIVPASPEAGTAPPVEPAPSSEGKKSGAQLSLSSPEPKAKAPKAEPLPFPVYTGLQAIAGKTQRFALPEQSELSKGRVIALGKQVRRFPKLEEWTLAGEYLEANGDGWRGSVGVSLVASDRFGEIVAAARAWEKAGRRKMDIRGSPVDPTKGRAESWEHKRLGLEDIGVEEMGNG